MRRVAAVWVVVSLLAAGCATGPGVRSRALAKGLLIGLAVVAAGGAVGSAVVSDRKEKRLRDDLEAGGITGQEFADRDTEGKRWNRAARASVFVGGLAIVGLLIASQMGYADRYQFGPGERPTSAPIYPSAAQAPSVAPAPSVVTAPAVRPPAGR